MHVRALTRAAAITAAALLLTTSVAIADTLPGDVDDVTPGIQGTVAVGPVAVNGSVSVPLWFQLVCRNAAHLDEEQTVKLAYSGAIVPSGGSASSTGTSIGPVPAAWPDDGDGCLSAPLVRSNGPAMVTLTAPGVAGVYDYTVDFSRTISPAGSGDGSALTSLSGATFRLTVVANTPPELVLPADFVVEGDTIGGAAPTFTVGATDVEDDPDPIPTCSPPSGSLFSLGETTVACSVTDAAGASASGSFSITVEDTTPPALVDLPTSVALVATDPAGTSAAYAPPSASDTVDGAPTVACLPAPGDAIPVGRTTVTCRASDASGNATEGSFPIDVTYVPPVVLTASLDEPVGAGGVLIGTTGRTVPVKARIMRDGVVVTTGDVDLVLERCGDGATVGARVALQWRGDRWAVALDTGGLLGCLRASVRLDGTAAGSFELRLGPSAATFRARSARA